jgi:sulfite reductase (NADPH) flavoprotein alpha-component
MLPKPLNQNQSTTQAAVSSALDINQLSSLQQAIGGLSSHQLAWASGYLAAKSENNLVAVQSTSIATKASQTLTILFSSQTGNAKALAAKLADSARAVGIEVNFKNVAEYKAKSLKSETHLLIVTSTNGEGEAPDDAIAFHEFLFSKKAPKLPNLNYSVLSLGDSSYEFFCQTGKDFDERLAALGAKQVAPRVDCDLDYDDEAQAWSLTVIESLKETLVTEQDTTVVNLPVHHDSQQSNSASLYNKQNPYTASLMVSQKITGRDSNKDVRHIEIDLADSGLTYQPGDALGVWFENSAVLVDELLQALNFNADEKITLKLSGEEKSWSLKEALIHHLEITQTAPAFIDFWAGVSSNEMLVALVADKNAVREYSAKHQIVDVIKQAPLAVETKVDAQAFVNGLRKLTPRLYSIASSQAEVEEEVHLTLGVVSYQHQGNLRLGGASGFLAQALTDADECQVKVFIEHNDNFRLPENGDVPVIMIGPGTGVAPFRSFMQEREAAEANGDNWMFFGDQTFTQDFLYQVEWQSYLKSGLLTKMDVAFSRDQAEKVYVQDRLKENAEQVFAWLERGAHLYVCGDANRMAKDVHQTLLEIIIEQGGLNNEQAEDYLKALRSNKRYQKDVY